MFAQGQIRGIDATPENHGGLPADAPTVVVCHGLTGGSHESYVRNILAWVAKPKEDGGLGGRGVVVNVSWFHIMYVYVWLTNGFTVSRLSVASSSYVKTEKLMILNRRRRCPCNLMPIVFCRYHNGSRPCPPFHPQPPSILPSYRHRLLPRSIHHLPLSGRVRFFFNPLCWRRPRLSLGSYSHVAQTRERLVHCSGVFFYPWEECSSALFQSF